MPDETPFALVDSYTQRITQAALTLRDSYQDRGMNVVEQIGSQSSGSSGSVSISLVNAEERPPTLSNEQLLAELRRSIGQLPAARSVSFRGELARFSNAIAYQLRSTDLASLQAVSQQLQASHAQHRRSFRCARRLG